MAECAEHARPKVLAATILGSGLAFLNSSTVNVTMPAMQVGLDASAADVQWILNGYALMLAALILVGGSAGDHFGLRRVFLLGIAIFTATSIWCGLAPDTTQLIAARVAQGIGGALVIPNSLAIIARSYPKNERGKAIGTWAGFAALTAAAGPLLGGWLVDLFSWRAVFFIAVPVAGVAAFLTMRSMPALGPQGDPTRLDIGGAILATIGLGGVTYGLIEGTDRGFAEPVILGTLALGVASLLLFLRRESRIDHPMMPLGLFRSSTFSGANILTLLLYFALGGVFFLLPFLLIEVYGFSPTATGAAFLPFTLVMGGLSRWSGGLIERFGAKKPLVIGPILTGLGYLAMVLPGPDTSFFIGLMPALLLVGIGMTIAVAPLTTVVMSTAEDELSGVASGINNAVARVAGLFAVAVLGAIALAVSTDLFADVVTRLSITDAMQSEVIAVNDKLATVVIPEGLSESQELSVAGAMRSAFLEAFRLIAIIAGVTSILGGLVAWQTIDEKIA